MERAFLVADHTSSIKEWSSGVLVSDFARLRCPQHRRTGCSSRRGFIGRVADGEAVVQYRYQTDSAIYGPWPGPWLRRTSRSRAESAGDRFASGLHERVGQRRNSVVASVQAVEKAMLASCDAGIADRPSFQQTLSDEKDKFGAERHRQRHTGGWCNTPRPRFRLQITSGREPFLAGGPVSGPDPCATQLGRHLIDPTRDARHRGDGLHVRVKG
jgi:hypothetical protein